MQRYYKYNKTPNILVILSYLLDHIFSGYLEYFLGNNFLKIIFKKIKKLEKQNGWNCLNVKKIRHKLQQLFLVSISFFFLLS